MDQLGLIGHNHLLRLTLGQFKGSLGGAVGRGSQPGSMMLWAGNSIGEGSSFSSIGPIMQLHGMELLGFPKVSNFPRGVNMLRAPVKFSLLTLGVDAKGSTCPGNLTSGQPVSLHSTEDRTSFLLQGSPLRFHLLGKDKELY